jgi:hypothetical protein
MDAPEISVRFTLAKAAKFNFKALKPAQAAPSSSRG